MAKKAKDVVIEKEDISAVNIYKKDKNIDDYEIYPNIKNEEFISEIYNKTEFVINAYSEDFSYENELDVDTLMLKNHQLFIKNYLSVHTPYKKIFLYHSVGTGKTLSSWAASKTFIEEFKKYNKDEETPKIYIIGYTENTFKKEFISRPELGYVSTNELDHLAKIKGKHGSDSKEYTIERGKYYQRLADRNYDGYYRFYGYKELYNKMFKIIDPSIDTDFNMRELLNYIKEGKIETNKDILNDFENSLIICDEIHNLYNSDEGNKSGLCIRYITNTIHNLKSIYLSATPLKNDPRELFDLVNLLSDQMNDIMTNDEFQNVLSGIESLEKFVKDNLKGKVSVYENIDLRYYPERIINGETIKNISLLKFVRCYMSNYYFDNYVKLINYNKDNITLSQTDRIYEDIILPEILNDDKLIAKQPQKYKDTYDIDYDIETERSYGSLYNKSNLKKYSPKYYEMINKLEDSVGKVFIYHNFIRKGGVNMIASILSENGYIEHDDTPNNNTRCSMCKKELKTHGKQSHDFTPLKYIIYTGELSKNIQDELIKMFEFNNSDGHNYKVIIGSSALSESKDLKEINNCYIMTLPVNVSTLIQVIGRCTRRNSHITLPVDRQYVDICLFIHSMTNEQKNTFKEMFGVKEDVYSLEEFQYKKKTDIHMEIQIIENMIREVAVDNGLYPNNSYEDELSFMYREKKAIKNNKNDKIITISNKNLDNFSYIHHNYIADALDFTVRYIHVLLKDNKILHVNDILEFFYQHDYIVSFNTRLINKNYILHVLNKILLYNSEDRRGFNNSYSIGDNRFIIRVDDYILLVDDINNIYNDVFSNQKKSKKINIFNYIDNIDDDMKSIFKNLESKVVDYITFFDIFDDIIPSYILKNELEKSTNKIIKTIMSSIKKHKKIYYSSVGFIDTSQNFKIKSSIFKKGLACNSFKKSQFLLYFQDMLDLEDSEIQLKKIYELCNILKHNYLEKEINSPEVRFFEMNL